MVLFFTFSSVALSNKASTISPTLAACSPEKFSTTASLKRLRKFSYSSAFILRNALSRVCLMLKYFLPNVVSVAFITFLFLRLRLKTSPFLPIFLL